ncbi:MAG: septum formation initiator family protein [Sphingomonadales bacterium]
MNFVEQIRFRLRRALPGALILVTVIYFGYHTLEGDHGLFKLQEVEAQMAEVEAKAAVLQARKKDLSRKVSSLRKDNLDLDLLDERARAVLGFQEPGEIVIYTDKPEDAR